MEKNTFTIVKREPFWKESSVKLKKNFVDRKVFFSFQKKVLK